jgi:hypothetical protein
MKLKPVLCIAMIALAASIGAVRLASAQDRAAVVGQKLRLLSTLLNSPRAKEIAAAGDPAAQAAYAQARAIFDEASGLQASSPERAEPLLDNALRLISQAGRSGGTGALAASQLRQQNAELLEQVSTYRKGLADAARRSPEAGSALAAMDQLVAQAAQHAAGGRLGDSNRLLAQAYQLAIAAVSKARAGETVVIDLRFETPADEFAYEERRFRSHQMLVEMMLAESRHTETAKKAVEAHFAQGRETASRAQAQAASGDHASAIRAMEEATRHLTRGLQLLGMQVF